MIVATYQPSDYKSISEVLAQGICLARSGRSFSYLDTSTKQRHLMTPYHLRTIHVQARINGKIHSMTGAELANHISPDGIRLHITIAGVPVQITEKSAMGSAMVQYKQNQRKLNSKA